MKKMKLVVVGNGMAGMRAVEELLKIAPELYDITVFGAEPHPNYNRILLSPVLAGEQTLDEIVLNPLGWYAEHGITLHVGKTVVGVEPARALRHRRRRHRAPNTTGCCWPPARRPSCCRCRARAAGRDRLPRHRRHASHDRRRRALPHAVVIGGGLLGLEAANGLMRRGMDVHGGAPDALADGAPARRRGRRAAAAVAGSARPEVPDRRRHPGLRRRCRRPGVRGAVQGRPRGAGRPGGDGRRHPPQHRAGREHRPALPARHRRQRHAADHDRPAHLRRRRMRRAPRHRLRAGGAAVRAGQGLRHAPGAVRHRPLHRQPDQHQAQGHRHRPVLGRQLQRRRRLRRDRA